MKNVKDKVAFITGGASGIGFGMCQAFIEAGMKVAIADVREEALNEAVSTLGYDKHTLLPVLLDVTDRDAWVKAADAVENALGGVKVLCNNAGITIDGPMQQATFDDWDFCLGINLGGVINGIQTFLPRMLAAGNEAHIVNTSSMGGLIAGAGSGVYSASKFAVVGLTEELRSDLADSNIGVSVFCPGPTRTDLFNSSVEVRPDNLSETGYEPRKVPLPQDTPSDITAAIYAIALQPVEAGRKVLNGIRQNDMYIITHPEFSNIVQARCEALMASMPQEEVSAERAGAARLLLTDKLYSGHIASVRSREAGYNE